MPAPRIGPFTTELIVCMCAASALQTGALGFVSCFVSQDRSGTALCAAAACMGATLNSIFIGAIAHRLRGGGAA